MLDPGVMWNLHLIHAIVSSISMGTCIHVVIHLMHHYVIEDTELSPT